MRHYIVNYEIMEQGRSTRWGNMLHKTDGDVDNLMGEIQAKAISVYPPALGIKASDVRIVGVFKL